MESLPDIWPQLFGIGVLGLAAGFLAAWLIRGARVNRLEIERMELRTRLEQEEKAAKEKIEALEAARDQLKETFRSVATEALDKSKKDFLQLAQERFGRLHTQASSEFEKREKAVENIVKPIKEALDKTESQIKTMEKERKEAYGNISRYLETMTLTQRELESETKNLVKALRRPEVRGQWGEMTLKRLAELAGMIEHCDFYEQENTNSDEGRQRPDMIVRLPDRREVVVDAKTPMDSYLSAVEATTDEERKTHLAAHARKVRERVRELALKSYWNQFKQSPEFVILFIPGEQFLSAAQEQYPQLLEDAFKQKVIPATPTSFIALLKAIAYGWRQVALAENAEKIREAGEALYKRLATFGDHLDKVGQSLGRSVDHYNKAVGSLERNVLPGARKFTEMGVQAAKPMPELDPLDHQPRRVESDRNDNDE